METTLAILMVLGIFLGIPAVIGAAIAGVFYLSGRRALRAERARALGEAVTEALREQPAEVGGEAVAKEATEERVSVG